MSSGYKYIVIFKQIQALAITRLVTRTIPQVTP